MNNPLDFNPVQAVSYGTLPISKVYAGTELVWPRVTTPEGPVTFRVTAYGGVNEFTLTFAGAVDITIDWGDGSPVEVVNGDDTVSHIYAADGNYGIYVTGEATEIDASSNLMLADIVEFTPLATRYVFEGCSGLLTAPAELPNTVTSAASMFKGCSKFNGVVGGWDTSRVTDMSGMFSGCLPFNQPLGGWDTSLVTSMAEMFQGCGVFNCPLNDWITTSVTDMTLMFSGCAAFDQPLDKWDTTSVTDMTGMFQGATRFNQPINSWYVGNVEQMNSVFRNATTFNQPLDQWDTSGAISMLSLFNGAANFNQPIDGWEVGGVGFFQNMFQGAVRFNQPLNSWVMTEALNMTSMFQGATVFNQPLNNWDIRRLGISTSAANFLTTATAYSTANWDSLLVAWDSRKATYRKTISVRAASRTSTSGGGAAAKASLIAYGWTIVDGGNVP